MFGTSAADVCGTLTDGGVVTLGSSIIGEGDPWNKTSLIPKWPQRGFDCCKKNRIECINCASTTVGKSLGKSSFISTEEDTSRNGCGIKRCRKRNAHSSSFF